MHISLIVILLSNCNSGRETNDDSSNKVPGISYRYIKSYPHDTTSFTEGLVMHDGKLYESTGATNDLPQTRSLFGHVDLSTGKINVNVEIDRQKYFGEGISFLKDKVYQLTYKSKIGFIYDAKTFKQIGEFKIPTMEGWGLTTDGKELIMSDGTNILTYLDANSLKVTKKLSVTENGTAKYDLNELEYFNDHIYANLWNTNTILKIDPNDGRIVGQLDLTSFASEARSIYLGSLEMNGIAYDSLSDRVFVTGKLWPKIYEIVISK
jgi:glutaminyl-peptide cyclotransferase